MSSVELKTKEEIAILRKVNLIVYDVLNVLSEMVRPGITTGELDRKARELTDTAGAVPAFLNYPASTPGVFPFPGVICASVNDTIVHGIPGDDRLEEGDILSIDFGCFYRGFCGDAAVTVGVGGISKEAERLLDVTRQSLEDAISNCYADRRIGDISFAVQSLVESNGFGVVREFVGHGIGRKMHEPPHVPNFGRPGQGRVLRPGMVIAIEPMVTAGGFETKIMEDGWTAKTKDASLAAHFEHSVAITEGEPFVLSRP